MNSYDHLLLLAINIVMKKWLNNKGAVLLFCLRKSYHINARFYCLKMKNTVRVFNQEQKNIFLSVGISEKKFIKADMTRLRFGRRKPRIFQLSPYGLRYSVFFANSLHFHVPIKPLHHSQLWPEKRRVSWLDSERCVGLHCFPDLKLYNSSFIESFLTGFFELLSAIPSASLAGKHLYVAVLFYPKKCRFPFRVFAYFLMFGHVSFDSKLYNSSSIGSFLAQFFSL